MTRDNYEAVIGLEIHVELTTASKMFCSCGTGFGAAANTQCCPFAWVSRGLFPYRTVRR